ncbi:glycosyl transferase [Leptolyngbya sp. Heron Island J]|uniref:glycosyltransferase family 2 protein n=1 Tax=Leptolyngbya sp. Heron Island J TaxID=1385935 RepID=UPI0003B9839A|nr:glycosyltransferase [Leptolyngbya sp. Heron Island J]ESA37700.1 glycosyl transferase [Leptolyngbya sp. Heron Island J]
MKQELPLVSIVINNYNYGAFVGQAIESALNQSYKNVEVVVVDDGSTDYSREIISSYGDQIIAVFQDNGGQAAAFNAGFAKSSGDIICLLDADDLVLKNRAEQVASLWLKHPEIDWFFHESAPVDASDINQTTLKDVHAKHAKDLTAINFEIIDFKANLRNAELPYFAPSTSNLCFSRSLLEKCFPLPEVKGFSGLAICDFYLRIVATWLGNGIKSEDYLGVFRLHANNLYTTQTVTKKQKTDCEILLFTAYYLLLNYPQLAKLSKKLLAKTICLHRHVREESFNYSEIIEKCSFSFPYLERLEIYFKAMLYSIKLRFSKLI